MDRVLRTTIQSDHSGKTPLPLEQSNINRSVDNQLDDVHRQIGTIHQTIDDMTVNFNYAPQSNTGGNTGGTSNELTEVKQEVTTVKQDMDVLAQSVVDNTDERNSHIFTSDNNFSIEQIALVSGSYILIAILLLFLIKNKLNPDYL